MARVTIPKDDLYSRNITKVWLEFPVGIKPRIRKGSWLAEITNTGLGPYDPATPTLHRRSFDFYRISEVVDEEVNSQANRHYVALQWPLRNTRSSIFSVVIFDGLKEVYNREGLWR